MAYKIRDEHTLSKLTSVYQELLIDIGEDPQRDGLKKTPSRAAKALLYLTRGYEQNLDELINGALFESTSDELVLVRDVEFYSLCEHHLLPFFGRCHVAYLPSGKVLGLSKVARIIDMYSRRLQIQEQLTGQVASAVKESTGAYGVAVIMKARHMCMTMRGVEKQESTTITSATLGTFRNNPAARSEFMNLVGTL